MNEVSFDEDGNELSFDGLLYKLKLSNEKEARNVGEIHKLNGKIYLISDRNFDKHFFRKTFSWGFSSKLIETFFNSFCEGNLEIRSDVGTFSIRASDALAFGEYLHFKKMGFELQLMVHHSYFNKSGITEVFNKFVETEASNET